MEYSLVYGDGKIFGLINGAAFTPRQDASASFISQHHHSIDSLLRYKECGATPTLVGKEQQKGLELFVVDLTDKDNRKTRYYISARSLRILWLEYEEGSPGGTPVKFTKNSSTTARCSRPWRPIAPCFTKTAARVRKRACSRLPTALK